MRRKLIFQSLILLIMLISLNSCNGTNKKKFDFSFQYNYRGDDIISTYDNTFKLHTVNGYETIDLELTKAEKTKIMEFIISNNLDKLKGEIDGGSSVFITPHERFTLNYSIGDKTNEIKWDTMDILSAYEGTLIITLEDIDKETQEIAKKLVELNKLIIDIIYSYEEVKELPDHMLYD